MLAKENIMKEGRELPNEEGDAVREYKATHEENFWSSWLREDERGKEERTAKVKNEGERDEKRKREEEKEENETVTGKRRCEGFVSVEAFEIFSQGRDLESCGDVSWEHLLEESEDLSDREPVSCELVRVVPDVIDVPSSVVTELCDVSPCCSDWEFVEPQSFSFTKKRAHYGTDTQEEMKYEGPPVIAPPLSRRRMTPPTPVQHSYTSFVSHQGRYEEEGRGWNARERTIIVRTKQFLERSRRVKVQVEALEALLGPEDVVVDLKRILTEARDEQGRNIFEAFSSNDTSFLVADWSRWDKYKRAPWRQDPSASASDGWWQASLGQLQEQLIVGWSQIEKRVIDAVEDYLENCAPVKVEIELVESLLRPEDLEVSLRYVLKHATYKGQQLLPALRHITKAQSLYGKQKTMVGKSGKRRCEAGEWEKRVVRPWVSRSQGKSSAVPQQHFTDSSASAALVVGQRRRRSLGSDGRKAKEKDCLRRTWPRAC